MAADPTYINVDRLDEVQARSADMANQWPSLKAITEPTSIYGFSALVP